MDVRRVCYQLLAWLNGALFLVGVVWVRHIAAFDDHDSFPQVTDRVVDAVNCGGGDHRDVFGVQYRRDPLEGRVGVASDFGKRYLIGRVPPEDLPLYQTERYSTERSDLEYEFSVADEGDYVLVLKFSEVYFESTSQKVFDVYVNNDHEVVSGLDIFAAVGKAVAHDELVPFTIAAGKLRINDEVSDYRGKLRVQFRKGDFDNPKVNAIVVLRGKPSDVPVLPPLRLADDEDEPVAPELDDSSEPPRKAKHASGPKAPDPYAAQDQSMMFLPILVALACFFPVLFCLCKL